MTISFKRRQLSIGLPLAFGLGGIAFDLRAATSPLAELEHRYGGRLGVFAVDTGSGKTLAHRADERFLMCSTFKGMLAAQVLARVDQGKESLQRSIPYTRKDLIFTSPTTLTNVGRGSMTVGELCQATVELSDNTAAILLMRNAGGPEGLTAFLRSLGDTVTRSDRYEPMSNQYSGERDTTTPRAIVGNARAILTGDVLSPDARQQLEDWMIACRPGRNRLRAALPADWQAGDRPGTSVERQTNDYAIVRPPQRNPLFVAAYYDAPTLDMSRREAALREVGEIFVAWAQTSSR
ncbi:class A beta-lactamase [Herbaspirillum sp. C7C2]|uniref:class A beta-lactamase n=1 Tax=Herbaspirillum sp. C7C2 TaxID=2736666 RepID=UPI001F525FCD|nr:class A beta-lactamase [Herbaspirillum sp. C7C2]MCI1015636.1 class A beta-lactamase [Herbaspirillum sp. C7C2]